jgi:predicted MPP superfamily phosphohydrolase
MSDRDDATSNLAMFRMLWAYLSLKSNRGGKRFVDVLKDVAPRALLGIGFVFLVLLISGGHLAGPAAQGLGRALFPAFIAIGAVVFGITYWLLRLVFEIASAALAGALLTINLRPLSARSIEEVPPTDPICLQISDLHLTPGTPIELRHDRSLWPADEGLPAMAERLELLVSRLSGINLPIVATGDLTDSGDETEWALASRLSSLSDHGVFVVPGNHDINLSGSAEPLDERAAEINKGYYLARLWKAAKQISGSDEATPEPVLTREFTSKSGVVVSCIMVDSNRRRSRWLLSNAIGYFDRFTKREILRALDNARERVIIAMHHHPSLTSEDVTNASVFTIVKEHFLGLVSARWLKKRLTQHLAKSSTSEILIIHGHRHTRRFSELSDRLKVWGMPSSTMGNQRPVKNRGDNGLHIEHDTNLCYAVIGLTNDQKFAVGLEVVE